MCKNCFDGLRIQMIESNDQAGLAKLDVLEQASQIQEKATGTAMEGFEIMMALVAIPIEYLQARLVEYKKTADILRQMREN